MLHLIALAALVELAPGPMVEVPAPLAWHADPAEAVREARARDADILALFTGTSWCGPCMRLHQEVLARPDFREVGRTFVLLKLEYPKADEEIPEGRRGPLVDWRERYAAERVPTLFLLDRDARPYALAGDLTARPDRAAAELDALRAARVRRDGLLARAAAGGPGEVEALDAALSGLATGLDADGQGLGRARVARFYGAEVDRLLARAADPALAARYRALRAETPDSDPARAMADRVRAVATDEGVPAALRFVAENLARPQPVAARKVLLWSQANLLDRSLDDRATCDALGRMAGMGEFTPAENRQIRVQMLRSLVRLGRVDESLRVMRGVVDEAADDPRMAFHALQAEANQLEHRGRDAEVAALWEEAARHAEPGSAGWVDAGVFRARALGRLGRAGEAVALLHAARGRAGLGALDRAHLHAEEGMILRKAGDRDGARRAADEGEAIYRELLPDQGAEALAFLKRKLDSARRP